MNREAPGTAQDELPAVFTVGAGIGIVKGGGKLTVDRKSLIFDPDRPTRGLSGTGQLVHTKDPLVVLKARLAPPWFNTSLLLHDDETSAHLVLPVWLRRRLRATLRAAEFHPTEVSTWLRLSAR